MSTLTLSARGNLFDVLKLKAPDGSALSVANTLVETNDLIKDLPSLPSNGGLFHSGVRTTSLPSGTLVNVGGTWGASKSERTPFVEALATLRSRYQVSRDVLQTEGKAVSQMLVSAEKDDHIEGMGQSWVNLLLEGPSAPQQNAIVGLMGRAPWNAIDSEYTFDTLGVAPDLRSAWLIQPGPTTVHLIYNPNHPTLGIEMEDMGKVFVQKTVTEGIVTEARWDIVIEFLLQQGICIRDQRAVKRIANIACGSTDTPDATLINNVIRASHKHNLRGSKTWFLYCDAEVYTQLVIGANNSMVQKVHTSAQNIYQTELPMIGPNVIVRRMDALNHEVGDGETQVEAA